MIKIKTEKLTANLANLNETVIRSCKKSGRDPKEVMLLAVTKTVSGATVNALSKLGINDFGENRAHIGIPKVKEVSIDNSVWHFIGHLQSRKAKLVIPAFRWVHSVDSVKLAQKIQKSSAAANTTTNILLEIKTSEEDSKYGIKPENAKKIITLINELPNINIKGLMTMAPFASDPEECRPYFRTLAELKSDIEASLNIELPELSMGMSNDYAVAIEEGATIIRVGSALYKDVFSDNEEY